MKERRGEPRKASCFLERVFVVVVFVALVVVVRAPTQPQVCRGARRARAVRGPSRGRSCAHVPVVSTTATTHPRSEPLPLPARFSIFGNACALKFRVGQPAEREREREVVVAESRRRTNPSPGSLERESRAQLRGPRGVLVAFACRPEW